MSQWAGRSEDSSAELQVYRLIRGKRSNGNYSTALRACPTHLKRKTQMKEMYLHLGSGSRRQITLFAKERERVKGDFIYSMNRDIVSKMYQDEDAVVIGVGVGKEKKEK